MNLRPSIRARERILVMGVQGTGKSYGALSIARRCEGQKVYIVDSEDAYERMLADPLFENLENVEHYPIDADDWVDWKGTIEKIHEQMERTDGRPGNDWLILDNLTPSWDAVQSWYTDQIFEQGIDEYFLQVRIEKEANKKDKDKSNLGAFDGWKDWSVINKQYAKMHRLITKTPGHLYIATEQTATDSSSDDKEIKSMFGPYGVKPKGQKRVPHLPHTILYLTKSRAGEYAMTTIKDRSRVELVDEPFKDFGMDYLRKVAGWKPGPS